MRWKERERKKRRDRDRETQNEDIAGRGARLISLSLFTGSGGAVLSHMAEIRIQSHFCTCNARGRWQEGNNERTDSENETLISDRCLLLSLP
jgi:hypothetical protein